MNSLTYKNDDSFFTTVIPPFVFYGSTVKRWFSQNTAAKFRYIRDMELEKEFWNIEQVNDMYPGIKTISVVVNPWKRMYYAYTQLCKMKSSGDTSYLDISILKLDSFDDFINSLPTMEPIDSYWFTLATPLSKWFDYAEDGRGKTVDYILKDSTIKEDFQSLQDYFCTDTPLDLPKKLPSYKKFYNKQTKAIVADIFREDIERFGYKF
jgi:hypothetical protein